GFAWLAPQDRTERMVVDSSAFGFAEVHVVHGGEPAQQITGRPSQRARSDALELVVGLGPEPLVSTRLVLSMEHDGVVGDRGQLERVDRHLSAMAGRAWPFG